EPTSPGENMYFTGEDSSDPDTSDTPKLTFFWEFGDGNSTNGMFVSWHYARPGSYTVNLTVTDDNGAFDIDSFTVNVLNRAPVADGGEDVEAVKGTDIQFDGSASYDQDPSGTIINWTWDMDNGDILYEETFTYNYTIPDTYTVTLVVRDNNGQDSEADEIIVVIGNELPFNLSIDAPETANESESINITGSAEPPDNLTYSWDFGDGNISTQQNPSHTYENEGNYTIKLTVSVGEVEASLTQTIEVANIKPVASFTPSKTSAKTGKEIEFDASASLDVADTTLTYAWNFGDGVIGYGMETSHAYALPGVFPVTLTVNDGTDDSEPVTKDITIMTIEPVASFTLSTNKTETGEVVVFDASDSTGVGLTYTWDFGDNSTANGIVVTHKYTKKGTYNVTLTVFDGTTQKGAQKRITITKGAAPPTEEEGGIGMLGLAAIGLSIFLLILLIAGIFLVTGGKPKELPKVIKSLREGKSLDVIAPEKEKGPEEAEVVEAAEAVKAGEVVKAAVEKEKEEETEEIKAVKKEMAEAVEAERFEEAAVLRDKLKDLMERHVEEARKEAEEKAKYESKRFSHEQFLLTLKRERDLLKSDLDKEESEAGKKELERQLKNLEERIGIHEEKLKMLEEEEKEKEKARELAKEMAKKAEEEGVVDAEMVGLVPKPGSLIKLEETRNAIDRLSPAQDDELERKKTELSDYEEYESDPDYTDYIATLRKLIKGMEAMAKRSSIGSFPKTSFVAEQNEELKSLRAKSKKQLTKEDKEKLNKVPLKIQAFEKIIGQTIDELLDELYEEAVEEIDVQIAEEEAAWEEAKAAAEAEAEAKAAEAKPAEEVEEKAKPEEAEVGEAVEAEIVTDEAMAAEIEGVEVEGVEVEGVEVEGVEVEGVEVEGVEVEGVEVEGVEVEGVEVEGIEAEGVEVEGVEVEGVEIEGVEVEGIEGVEIEAEDVEAKGKRAKKKRAAKKKAETEKKKAVKKEKKKKAPAPAKAPAAKVTCPQCRASLSVGTDKRPY
ncbi:MAG: PKD domain-containing protein, partial [Thermoplasmata archaeon]|nr:PKD domain-containing protein [Thermoplasmata archaeon]